MGRAKPEREVRTAHRNLVPVTRRDEVESLLDLIRRWAAARVDLRAVALVGSWARDQARARSDVDVLLLTVNPGAYLDDERWIDELGADRMVRTQRWGVVTERRVAMASGLEVEFGVTSPCWACTEPVDAGTRAVVCHGLVALYDAEGVLARLLAAVS